MKKHSKQGFTLVEIETDTGLTGIGITGITDTNVVSRVVERVEQQHVGDALACVDQIVTQVHELRMRAPITNIVFMGMGEPLHNFEHVLR